MQPSAFRSHPTAVGEWRRRRTALRRNLLKPPPRLTISEWADRNRIIPVGTSPEPGPWRTDRVPYLRGIMDALSDRRVQRVAAMLASQVGKTEVVLNVLGYYIDQEPSPILVVQPSEKPMGEAFSKDRLAPMITACPSLRGKVKAAKVKDSGNTVLHKVFPGGYVSIAGANSASGLASRPIRILLCDEIDRYPASAGSEGDPVSLGIQRTANFTWTRKIFLPSTPTLAGFSRIEKEWLKSDQRRYFVPCPHCGHMQHLRWGAADEGGGLKWERIPEAEAGSRQPGDILRKGIVHRTSAAAYLCESCATLIDESRKTWMLRCGEWRATNTAGEFPGFHLNALCSPWVTWASLAVEWLEKVDDSEQLQTFVNTKLAETYEDKGQKADAKSLEARAEQWDADVPDGVGVLTAAVDVQGSWLELLVRGWGVAEESWDILHERIEGDPESADTWARLDALLAKEYRHECGGSMRVMSAMVDARYSSDAVYRFVVPRQGRGIVASIGDKGQEGTPALKRARRPNAAGVRLALLGVFGLKDSVMKRLRIAKPGPRYMHLRAYNSQRCNGFDAEYFAQFESEKIVSDIVKGSRRPRRRFVQKRERNEALDLHAYNLAALQAMGAAVREMMPAWVEVARKPVDEKPAAPEPEEPRGNSWVNGGDLGGGGGWVGGWRR